MSELKAVHAFDVYEAYTKTGDDDAAKVYLKSEADKVIAHNKYKRCLAMAEKCESMCYWFSARFDHHELVDNVKWELFDRWRLRWAKLADKFKEAK